MIEETFGEDPTRAQFGMPVEKFVQLGGPLKPAFIHHPRTKELIRDVVADLGCALEETYLDVPRLRLATSHGYLTAGVGYAFHPHRDTWYSAPMAQLNWWIPIYDFGPDAGMAFHPRYMHEPIRNGSAGFNYYRWNADGRKNAAQHIKADTRVQPKPEQEIELDPQIRIMGKAGSVLIFSAAHLHSTVPNTSGATRFSIDFRTVNLADIKNRVGARNLDSHCTGTSLRDFMRGTDLQRMPEEIVAMYDDGSASGGITVFTPEVHKMKDKAA
ncbi:phytanoyl-CoA dioxygenase family protein [Geminicoccus flavidas]|uniref:phytanoyl-CoA dioxygenase family protein n=1 Tax=Geminicoccus flavidas TaxID=2506407 RepID=UPI00190F2EAB|nr:phytanoyl-CoA dioxygenase family protein [Geminicoccus flavidas]